jgi:predicted nucleotidyltransferase
MPFFTVKTESSCIGTMTSIEEIRAVLRECLPEIREKYGVTSIGIFGSWARGEAGPNSDIDIIVELGRPIGWELVDLADYLESRLYHKVDLVIRRALHPLIRDEILAEVQYA